MGADCHWSLNNRATDLSVTPHIPHSRSSPDGDRYARQAYPETIPGSRPFARYASHMHTPYAPEKVSPLLPTSGEHSDTIPECADATKTQRVHPSPTQNV